MKKALFSILSFLLAGSVYAQLNTFSEGDVISAEQMNQNFEYLEQQFRSAQSITVDCAAGETINEAIENGFTDITVSGACNENLKFIIWSNDANSSSSYFKRDLANNFIRITGATSETKIVDASQNAEAAIYVEGGTTLLLQNLSLEGGESGIRGNRNSVILLKDVQVRGFKSRGISIVDSSFLGSLGDLVIQGDSARYGILLYSSSSWQTQASISGVQIGMASYAGSHLFAAPSFDIQAMKIGIDITSGSVVEKWGDGNGTISGTEEASIDVNQGILRWTSGTLEIGNSNSGKGINLWQSKAEINNLKLLEFDNTGTGWNPAIRVGNASALNLNNSEISGETDDSLINIDRSSMLEIGTSSISGTAGDKLIYVGRQSLLEIQNSTVSGTAGALLGVDRGSTLHIESGTFSGTAQDALIGINHGSNAEINDKSVISITSAAAGIYVGGSNLNFKNSSISGSVTQHLIGIESGSDAEISDSTLTLISGQKGLTVAKNSYLKLRNSSLVGPATDTLVQINRVSSVDIENGSTLGQTNADTPDVRVSDLSFLSIWNEDASINKVDCNNKGYVSANEGIVTNLATSCTE